MAVFAWTTVAFGARFSNLTNRGIITNGPYRLTKHPAYLVKNVGYWMMAVPFMPRGSPDETLSRCLLLLGLNFIYFMRAKTEEWHLSRDPEYVQYALWMEEHGMLRFLKRVPVVRALAAYRAPERRA
jgi:protein-S-isoprenylcysteine O-methyltransferase Ste14